MNERALFRTILFAGSILTLASSAPLPTNAEPPGSDQLARLDDRLMRARQVRVTTPSGRLVAKRVSADVDGLFIHHLTTSSGEASPVPNPIPWDDVIRIDRRSNHALAGGLITGLVVGGAASVGIYSAGQQGNDIGGAGIALLGVPVIALLGAVVGAHMHSWHPIYRMPHAKASR